jgi:nucleoside-diphosphate-sugar epimerase
MAGQGIHVVFGAGQIGPLLAARLREQGKAVRVVRKSAGAVMVEGVEVMRGDAMDPAFCAEAVRGAEVVYHCMNTPYFARVWQETLPRLQANLVTAAGRVGARLVVLDNLYALGRTGGRPMTEETSASPCSKKGIIRARLHEDLMAAAGRGEVRVAVGRASDFYGPGAVLGHLGERFFRQVLAGKAGQVIVNPDTPHTYHFMRDVAAGLAALGLDAQPDGLWMLPCAPAVTTRSLVGQFAVALGRPVRLQRVPPLLITALGLFVPLMRELREMEYQWEEPFVVDDRRFRSHFGDLATSLDVGARETVAWAQAAFGRPRERQRLGVQADSRTGGTGAS